MESKIRLAEKRDLPSLLYLMDQLSPHNSQVDYQKAEKVLSDIINDDDYKLIVYEEDGKVVGTALLLIQKNLSHGCRPYGHIENVVVDSNYRGKGIGKSMLKYLIEEAKKYNCYKIVLNARNGAEHFYESVGFRKTNGTGMRIDL